jgi:hypothetical protein
VQKTIVTVTKLSWRRWRWMVDDITDRHGSYHGHAGSEKQARAAAEAMRRALRTRPIAA